MCNLSINTAEVTLVFMDDVHAPNLTTKFKQIDYKTPGAGLKPHVGFAAGRCV